MQDRIWYIYTHINRIQMRGCISSMDHGQNGHYLTRILPSFFMLQQDFVQIKTKSLNFKCDLLPISRQLQNWFKCDTISLGR